MCEIRKARGGIPIHQIRIRVARRSPSSRIVGVGVAVIIRVVIIVATMADHQVTPRWIGGVASRSSGRSVLSLRSHDFRHARYHP